MNLSNERRVIRRYSLNLVSTFIWCIMLTACSQTPTNELQAIEDSPTHPKVTQKPYQHNPDSPQPGEARFRPIRAAQMHGVQVPTGSLFNERRAIGLYQPSNQYTIGDMILVKLAEKTSAKKSLDFQNEKSSEFNLALLC